MNNDVFEKYSIPKAVASMALPTILGMLVTVFIILPTLILSVKRAISSKLLPFPYALRSSPC